MIVIDEFCLYWFVMVMNEESEEFARSNGIIRDICELFDGMVPSLMDWLACKAKVCFTVTCRGRLLVLIVVIIKTEITLIGF